ncbi:MAG: hypothetical protein QNK03_27980 [Myxococcota bacterium]|nr:hypothetical protein [Myxococcota bacterium]
MRLPRREEFADRTVTVLHRGERSHPDVLLVRCDGREVVIKDFAPRRWWVRWTVGRFSIGREVRAYRALEGLDAVPRYLGRVDPLAFAIEHRPGRRMSRRLRGQVPGGFVGLLEQAVQAMHARGVAHLDLRHRSNVLIDEAGQPVLIDFGSAVCFRPGSPLRRLLLPWLARIDDAGVRKWRQRLVPPAGGSSPLRRGASRPT